jgi:hypothetical protein
LELQKESPINEPHTATTARKMLATNSTADDTYLVMVPEQLLGVHGLATKAGAPSHIFQA